MAKARRILRRAHSVGNIRTVTKTMEMVATARFQKAHNRIAAIRPYTDHVIDMVGDVLHRAAGGLDHPLLHTPEDVQRDVLVIVTSDRGLCGGYNAAVIEIALQRYHQLLEADYDVELCVMGRRGQRQLTQMGYKDFASWRGFGQVPDFYQVGETANAFMDRLLAGEVSGVEVAYTRFIKSGLSRPVIAQILPLTEVEPPPSITSELAPYELHPSAEEILRNLLPATVRLRLYQCFIDAAVTEQMARIGSMRQATESADEMINDLTLQYNRSRQAQITTELAEIVGGREGVE